jgi:pimeloyl-ACP methyl ester carboxylesterase
MSAHLLPERDDPPLVGSPSTIGAVESTAVRAVLRGVLEVRKLVNAFPTTLRIHAAGRTGQEESWQAVQRLISLACDTYRMRELTIVGAESAKPNAFERAISDKLRLTNRLADMTATVPSRAWLEEAVCREGAQSTEARFARRDVIASDGAHLRVYSHGSRALPPLVLVGPCGMPVELSQHWLQGLAERHHVITWETRGCFELEDEIDAGRASLSAQAGDVFSVMDAFGVERAAIVGLCSGSLVALNAAALDGRRVTSASLWNGDFYALGDTCPRTKYQKNFAALMQMVATSPKRAAMMHQVFLEPEATIDTDPAFAHVTLYPFANPDLLHRYGKVNVPIVDTDLSSWIGEVRQPTLVVTSDEDRRAHPEGSRIVATALRAGRLHREPTGYHLSILTGRPDLIALASAFAREVGLNLRRHA